jgi:hypothetical protein
MKNCGYRGNHAANSYCSQVRSLRQYTNVCHLMMVVWPKHVVVIISEEQKKNCCVDGPIIALLNRCLPMQWSRLQSQIPVDAGAVLHLALSIQRHVEESQEIRNDYLRHYECRALPRSYTENCFAFKGYNPKRPQRARKCSNACHILTRHVTSSNSAFCPRWTGRPFCSSISDRREAFRAIHCRRGTRNATNTSMRRHVPNGWHSLLAAEATEHESLILLRNRIRQAAGNQSFYASTGQGNHTHSLHRKHS